MLDMQKDPRESIELVLPDGSSFQQAITYEQLPKICHKCHIFGHATLGCPGPEERERLRLEKRNREPSRARYGGTNRDPRRGRDTTVRGSANGRNQLQPAVVTHGHAVWKPSGKNKSNEYRGADPSSSKDLNLDNRFQALLDNLPENEDALMVEETVQETPVHLMTNEGDPRKKDKHAASHRDAVEDLDCDGLDDINDLITQNGQMFDPNVTIRDGAPSGINPLEFPLLEVALASGSGKKKKHKLNGPQGKKNPEHITTEPIEGNDTTTLALEQGHGGVPDSGAEVAEIPDPDTNPPSVRHRSKSRGPKKDLATGIAVRKKIGKSKRSLSCNTRPLGVSDFLDQPQ